MAKSINITVDDIIALLRKRGRPIRAGNDVLTGHIAQLLGYSTAQARDAVGELLRPEPEGIVIEFFDPEKKTRIKSISLPEWVGTDIEYEEVPIDEELVAAYARSLTYIQELTARADELNVALEVRNTQLTEAYDDLAAAEALLNEKSEGAAAPQIEQLKAENARLRDELAASERQADAARSARQSVLERNLQAAEQIKQLQNQLEATQTDADRWGRFAKLAQAFYGTHDGSSSFRPTEIPLELFDLVGELVDGVTAG